VGGARAAVVRGPGIPVARGAEAGAAVVRTTAGTVAEETVTEGSAVHTRTLGRTGTHGAAGGAHVSVSSSFPAPARG
jgi:hypothetical protein